MSSIKEKRIRAMVQICAAYKKSGNGRAFPKG